jgi:thiamine-phosphate pyrophosphorylase
MSRSKAPVAGFYAIADLRPDATAAEAASLVAGLLDGGAGAVQLRMKGACARTMLSSAREVLPLCRAAGVPLIVNDRLDVALACDADGVHLGQEDLPLEAARGVAPGIVVGVSTHSMEEALAAEHGGADYVGLGPIYPTATKRGARPTVGIAGLREVCAAVRLPVIAIGGIDASRAEDAMAAGAAGAAAIEAVLGAADVRHAARAMARACAPRKRR